MGKLLQFEFRKLSKQKSFYICSFLLLVFVVVSALLSKIIFENSTETMQAPIVIDMVKSALSGGNAVLIGIFTALFVCEDFTDGTIKNIYAKGYSRTKVYFSKFIFVLFFAVISCAICWLGGAVAGSLFFEAGVAIDGTFIATLLAQLMTILGYTCLFFAISMVFRKTGGAIAGCIVAPMLVSLVFNTADSLLNSENITLGKYWLDGFWGNLSQSVVSNETIIIAIAMSAVYMVLFTVVGALINRKQTI